MAVKMLKELIGTKYITDEHVNRLKSIFNSISPKDVVDLSQCKFMPGGERVLREYYATVRMCNSTDPELNSILEHNMIAKAPESQPQNIEDLPTGVLSQAEVVELFKTIDKKKVYRLGDISANPLKRLSLTILLMMKFPEIIFDLETNAARLFSLVRTDWLKYREHHDSYLEINKSAVIPHKVINGYVEYPGVGKLREDLFVTNYLVLPMEFGTRCLYNHPEFTEVWFNALDNLCKTMDATKIMRDYIEVVE